MSETPAYLLSLLCRQVLFGAASFRARYPGAWLVWEPGDYVLANTPEDETMMTRLPRTRYPERPSGGDALGFVLAADDGAEHAVGRAPENAVVISETSVSRTHCRIVHMKGVWYVTRPPEAMPMSLNRAPVAPGALLKLQPGHELILGNVVLTFHSTGSLLERLQGTQVRPSAPRNLA